MRVLAHRGVCIGVERHLTPGVHDVDLDPHTAQYLTSIGAIERLPDEVKPVKQVDVPRVYDDQKKGK